MTRYVRLLGASLLLWSGSLWAQTGGSGSSYSRFGLGTLCDQSQGLNRGMGGVGIALRPANRVVMANPASYSAIDSLTFIFDVGMDVALGNMKSGNTSINVNSCSLSYVNAGLRLRKHLGLSFGLVPYSSIGYSFNTQKNVPSPSLTTLITNKSVYNGEGGVHQAYIGVGWQVLKGLSVGTNVSFLWGNYRHSVVQSISEGVSTTTGGLYSIREAHFKTYKLDLGAQYQLPVSRHDMLTFGATTSIGHKIKGDATLTRYTSSNDDPAALTAHDAFDLPQTFGTGLAWQHKDRLTVALDYKYEAWGKCHTPEVTSGGDLQTATAYEAVKGSYKNRNCLATGLQYTPNPLAPPYWKRMSYRLGANLSTPYMKVNGADGPREYGITAGLGLPIMNAHNNRSIVNVSFQWLRRAPQTTAMIVENYFVMNIGVTFNERWFMKYKIK